MAQAGRREEQLGRQLGEAQVAQAQVVQLVGLGCERQLQLVQVQRVAAQVQVLEARENL